MRVEPSHSGPLGTGVFSIRDDLKPSLFPGAGRGKSKPAASGWRRREPRETLRNFPLPTADLFSV